jgi:signal transduction histidine kinase
VIDLVGKELEGWISYRNALSGIPDSHYKKDKRRVISFGFFSKGAISVSSGELLPGETLHILERFAAVFDGTYTRFLDLQRAEAQAREAQIETSLERVRARTMAMRKSDELTEVAELLFKQVNDLGIKTWTTGFNVWSEDNNYYTDYITNPQGGFLVPYTIDATQFPVFVEVSEAKKRGEEFYIQHVEGELLQETYRRLSEFANNQFAQIQSSGFEFPSVQYDHFVFGTRVSLMFITYEPVPAAHDIFKRFGKVFEQTYTRFLDLQKAEAQAREAQIEAALERVRSRSMAMHKSDELKEVIRLVLQQFVHLNINAEHAGFYIDYKAHDDMHIWLADPNIEPFYAVIPYFDTPTWNSFLEAKAKGITLHTDLLDFKTKNKFYKSLFKLFPVPEEAKKFYLQCKGLAVSTVLLKNVGLYIENFSAIPYTDEENEILIRIGKVFEQTYTRFLDLQKAEAQAREAQIETALERVRSKTMAMHNSQDVGETVITMFGEFSNLGIRTNRCGILIFKDDQSAEVWTARSYGEAKPVLIIGRLNLVVHPLLSSVYKAWQSGRTNFQYDLAGEDLVRYYDAINKSEFYRTQFDMNALPSTEFHSDFFFAEGAVFAFTSEPIIEEDARIIRRFAGVFGQTYRRYLDLLRAEDQAREAQIEAALERVRAKAMAMHNSNDLSISASLVFTELRKLGINPIRAGVGLLARDTRRAQLYSATSSESGDSLNLVGWVQLEKHPVLENIYDSWIQQYDYFPQLQGKQLESYYRLLLAGLSVKMPDTSNEKVQYGHFFSFSIGCLYAWSDTAYDEAQLKILKRFAAIIDLTFRRYLELQKAEAAAKEAVRQASLDRVRAEIASMRTVDDLQRITPVIWNELTILNVPFIRCGMFIMDDTQGQIHTFLSTPDGKAIASFHLDYSSTANISEVVRHWHENKMYITHWGTGDFATLAESLVQQGAIASREQYLHSIPAEGIYLHFLPFLQGMLYVGNLAELGKEDIHLVQSVADAFSTAYARYEDFNKLEAAKQLVDQALVNLKQAQQQLIQSEKMASLGELTAGIAHEIQNPLNFVNNFSEVSTELIHEMIAEVEKGNTEEARAIARDLVQNLEKINHHGKRADGIVKGMLQHSRSSSGQKELTDINALCDEYLRLAFHGLRAKDKTFNAKFETAFDPSIGKISVMPQEIGRVILNLINNAFYAVTDKKKILDEGFEPLVSVTTKKTDGRIEISIRDNGMGIPDKIREKIFQPFFTTKPTGQGTGLGLSLSYDIVTKGHGGSLNVESRLDEGANFIITLPVTS